DPHFLVVVAGRSARSEGIVEPGAVILADLISGIGEGRRALVGGDDEIRIVAVMTYHARRRHDLIVLQVIGDRQKGGDEGDIGLPAGLENFLAIAASGQTARVEAAFRTYGHDDRVFHLLRLDEAQDLGAVVLSPVGPAQATTGHR